MKQNRQYMAGMEVSSFCFPQDGFTQNQGSTQNTTRVVIMIPLKGIQEVMRIFKTRCTFGSLPRVRECTVGKFLQSAWESRQKLELPF